MKIAICGSLDFTKEIILLSKDLKKKGHKVTIPKTSEMILNKQITLEQIISEKNKGTIVKRAIEQDVIRHYFNVIKESDAILVANFDKKGIKNYVGGNTLIEIGFAHVLDKKVFLINDIPDMHYKEEILVMQPVVVNGDLSRIK